MLTMTTCPIELESTGHVHVCVILNTTACSASTPGCLWRRDRNLERGLIDDDIRVEPAIGNVFVSPRRDRQRDELLDIVPLQNLTRADSDVAAE